jgi:hypothetical protein
MSFGEHVTRWTIRAALVCCALAAVELLRNRPTSGGRPAQLWWTAGFVLYLAHVAAAFQFVHHWSHAAAYRHTAQQTYEICGIDWGGGLYFNYAFTLAWLADVVWIWTSGHPQSSRPGWLRLTWYAFFVFMVINATVVFEDGPARWLSLAAFVILGAWAFLRYK